MSLRDDDRGAAIQVGLAILLGFIVIAITLWQTQVVPQQNKGIEYNHNQKVQRQMVDLRSTIVSVAQGGNGGSVAIDLGTTYPSRTIFLNPTAPQGTLETTPAANLTLSNVTTLNSETNDYWNGGAKNFSTKAIVYRPDYNVYTNAPTTIYENTILYNRFDNANVTLTSQGLIDGSTITIVTINGSLQRSGFDSTSVELKPVSVSTRSLTVKNTSGPITISVPTLLSESKWRDLLSDESNVSSIDYKTLPGKRYNLLNVTLKPGEYTLRMAKVGVGDDVNVSTDESEYYVTADDTDKSVTAGNSVELTVEVRDRYNNPVAGEDVTFTLPDSSTKTVTTTSDGKASITYNPDSSTSGDKTITATIDGGGNDTEEVTFTVTVTSSSGGSSGGSSGAGQGGKTSYSTTNDTETISVKGGEWTDITKTDQIVLSNTDTVIDDIDGDSAQEEYVYLEFTIENASRKYKVEVLAYRDVGGGNEGGYVHIYSAATTTERTALLTTTTINSLLDSPDRYNGTDVLNRANFQSPTNGFIDYLRQVTKMDATKATIIVQQVEGRIDTTLQGEALIRALEPDPSTTNDKTEFVQLYFENETDLDGWQVSDDDSTVNLPAKTDFQGKLYLVKNKTAFLNAHPNVSSSRVTEVSLGLNNGGEALKLKDPEGNLRDEVAYGSFSTSHGWSLSIGTDQVGFRTAYSDGVYKDTDSASDWGTQSETNFFGSSGSVTYNGDALATRGNGNNAILSNVTFSVTNGRSSSVTITEIRIEPANSAIAKLSDPIVGEGKYASEFHVNVSGTTYTADFGGGKSLPTTFDLSAASNANDEPVIGPGQTATFYISQFLDSTDNEFDVVCENINVTLTFSDGSSTQFTIQPEDGVGGPCGASGTPQPGTVYRSAADNDLRSIDTDGLINDFGKNKPQYSGPMTVSLDSDSAKEVPYIAESGDLKIVDISGQTQTLVNSGITSTRLGVGTWDGSTSVFYVNGNGKLTRVRDGQSPQVIYLRPASKPGGPSDPVSATAVAGVADMNNDGDSDLVFVDDNQKIAYLEDNNASGQDKWAIETTGVTVNTASAVGAPADIDGDGTPEVPYNDGNGRIKLADQNGQDGTLTTGVSNEYPLATVDWTGDGQEDVIYVDLGPDNTNYYLKYVTGNGTVGYVRDSNGDKVQVKDKSIGVSSLDSPTATGLARGDATASDEGETTARVASVKTSTESATPPPRAVRPASLDDWTAATGQADPLLASETGVVNAPITSHLATDHGLAQGWLAHTSGPVQNSHTDTSDRPEPVDPRARFLVATSQRRQPAVWMPR